MYCKNCGKEIPEGATFCAECGTEVGKMPVKKPVDKKQKMIIGIIVAAVILVVLIACFAIGSDDEEKQETTVQTETAANVEETSTEAAEEKIYPVSNVNALLTTDKLINQKVSISGYINGAGAEIWLEGSEGDETRVYLYDIEDSGMPLVSEYLMGYAYGYHNVTGTFYYEFDEPAIFVDSIE